MRSSMRKSVGVLSLACVSLAACAVDGVDAGGGEPPDGITSVSDEILGGAPAGGGAGAVLISTRSGQCTGVAISRYVVLSAAHCFDGLVGPTGAALEGYVDTKIQYTKNGTTYRCVNGEGDVACDAWAPMKVRRYSGYTKSTARTNTGLDFAIGLIPDGGLSSYVDLVGVSPAAFESLVVRFYGAGHNIASGGGSGVMRTYETSLDWVGPEHFFEDAGRYRTCRGDSGGPYLFQNGWALGVLSNVVADSPTALCTKPGGRMRSKKINMNDINLINQLLATWNPTGPRCREVAADRWWCAP